MNNSILIIDDNDLIREALLWSLNEKGFTCFSAANGLEAWNLMEEYGAPALILLDMMMPVMDGYEFRRKKNAHLVFKNIPTVILSARYNIELQLHINEQLLAKPFELPHLFNIIKMRLDSFYNGRKTLELLA